MGCTQIHLLINSLYHMAVNLGDLWNGSDLGSVSDGGLKANPLSLPFHTSLSPPSFPLHQLEGP